MHVENFTSAKLCDNFPLQEVFAVYLHLSTYNAPLKGYLSFCAWLFVAKSLIVYHQALPQIAGGVPSVHPNKGGPSSLNCSRKGGQFSEHRESQDLKRDTNQRRAVNCHWIADRPDIHFSKLSCPKQRPPFMRQSIMTPKIRYWQPVGYWKKPAFSLWKIEGLPTRGWGAEGL